MKKKKEAKISKSKTNKVNKQTYAQADVYKALEQIEAGFSIRQVASTFKIPRSTLQAKKNFIVPVEASRGPTPFLTHDEEKQISEWISNYGTKGFTITKEILLQSVQRVIVQENRETPFKDNKPGRTWFKCFLSRHPDINAFIRHGRAKVATTKDNLRQWFNVVDADLEKNILKHIHPSRVFNLDQNAFFLKSGNETGLAQKGSKAVEDRTESITVLFNVNASGAMLPPLTLYWCSQMPESVIKSVPSGWFVDSTESGWMTADLLFKYIKTMFLPWLVENKIERPVVLFMNASVSHVTFELSIFCRQNGIHLYAIHPKATHFLQPLDVAIFNPLKSVWKSEVDVWCCANGFEKLKRINFAPLLKQALETMSNSQNAVINAFRSCGLKPFSVDAVDFDLLDKQKDISLRFNDSCTVESVVDDIANIDYINEATQHLRFFEQRLEPSVLEEFRSTLSSNSLITDVRNEGLYRFWVDLKVLCGEFS